MQAIESEKIPAIHTSEKVLKSRIYKELLKIRKKKKKKGKCPNKNSRQETGTSQECTLIKINK